MLLLSTCIALLAACQQKPKETLDADRVAKFAQIYQAQKLTWGSGYVILSLTGLEPQEQARPLARAQALLDRYVKGFYIALNANSKPEVTGNTFVSPRFEEFKYAALTCRIAQDNPEEMNKLTQDSQESESIISFCEHSVFYYHLMVESFTEDQVKTLNAWSLRRYFNKKDWEAMQANKFDFVYAFPTVEQLEKTSFAPYIAH
ncbi:hypothetical protein CKF54_05040 [Psittacicella hinzii]|uniref:Uncharacterized protein n=1 Tax=Psittacicella hinzii TaxID=2028575 RepID=A0A3A1Y2A4_9GAMM|nr:hypothetical protein [Psittacicella hinzii]RIY32363.1 hypothetical protein CKF54_05040 [Psittacicella hinzii]